jgi:hypothetical protein
MEQSAVGLIEVLVKQTPTIALLGYICWTVWKAYLAEREKKDALAETVVKITLLWEERYSKESADDKEIKEFMKEIREFIKDVKTKK